MRELPWKATEKLINGGEAMSPLCRHTKRQEMKSQLAQARKGL